MRQIPLDANDDATTAPATIRGRWHFPITTLSCCSVEVDADSKAGYAGYFANAGTSASFNLFEFGTSHPILSVDKASGKTHAYGRWILGAASCTASDVNFGCAVASATAQGSAKVETNTFKATLKGMTVAPSKELRDLAGQLDAKAMGLLGKALAAPVAWTVAESPKNGLPDTDGQPTPAPEAPEGIYEIVESKYNAVASCTFALNQIKSGQPLVDALEALSSALSRGRYRKNHSGIDPLTVAAVYHRFGCAEDKPGGVASKRAGQVLNGKEKMPAKNTKRALFRLDVQPYLNSDHSVPELVRLARKNRPRVAVQAWPPPVLPTTGTEKIGAFNIAAQTAFQVAAPGLFNAESNADFNFACYGFLKDYTVEGPADSIIRRERYSAGIKIVIASSAGDSGGSVEALAAKGTVRSQSVNYSISILGLDVSALSTLSAFVASSIGKFDVSTMSAAAVVYGAANDALTNGGPALTPVLTSVDVDLGADEVQALCDEGAVAIRSLRALCDGEPSLSPTRASFGPAESDDLSPEAAKALLLLGA